MSVWVLTCGDRSIKRNFIANTKHVFILLLADARILGFLNTQRTTYPCKTCGKVYNYYSSLARHLKHECGVEPKFHCPLCPYRTKHKSSLNTHLNGRHMKTFNDFYLMPNGSCPSSSDISDAKLTNFWDYYKYDWLLCIVCMRDWLCVNVWCVYSIV